MHFENCNAIKDGAITKTACSWTRESVPQSRQRTLRSFGKLRAHAGSPTCLCVLRMCTVASAGFLCTQSCCGHPTKIVYSNSLARAPRPVTVMIMRHSNKRPACFHETSWSQISNGNRNRHWSLHSGCTIFFTATPHKIRLLPPQKASQKCKVLF